MYCPSCGNTISEGASFCGRCGHQLSVIGPAPDLLPDNELKRYRIVAIAAILLIVLGAAVAVYALWPSLSKLLPGGSGDETAAESLASTTAAPTAINGVTNTAVQETTRVVDADPPVQTLAAETPPGDSPEATLTATAEPTGTPTPTASPTASLTPTPRPTATPDLGPEEFVIGYSVQSRPIEAVRFGNGPKDLIFIGGLHAGFAPGTVDLARRAVTYFSQNPGEIPEAVTLTIIISANPDSRRAPGELQGRLNANNVDLNRNWDCRWVRNAKWRGNVVPGSGGTAPFSEPETKSLADFIVEKDPVAVVFWEALSRPGLVSPGNCGRRTQASASLAGTYGLAAGYRVADFEDLTNQELNGDGTNWLDQQGIPSIAVLLTDYQSADWSENLAGMQAVLRSYAD